MKKIIIKVSVFLIVLVILFSGIFFIYSYLQNRPTIRVNEGLIESYPFLEDERYLEHLIEIERRDYDSLENVTGGKLRLSENYIGPDRKFICEDGSEAKILEYSYYIPGGRVSGGGNGIFVLDCGDYYFISHIYHLGPGPVAFYGIFE